MLPLESSTQTRACVVSVRTLAKSSPRTKSVLTSDVEERRFVLLERKPRRADVGRRQLAEPVAGLGARPQGLLVRPESDHERLPGGLVRQADQSPVPGAVAQPGEQLVADELQPAIMLVGSGREAVAACEPRSALHSLRAFRHP